MDQKWNKVYQKLYRIYSTSFLSQEMSGEENWKNVPIQVLPKSFLSIFSTVILIKI